MRLKTNYRHDALHVSGIRSNSIRRIRREFYRAVEPEWHNRLGYSSSARQCNMVTALPSRKNRLEHTNYIRVDISTSARPRRCHPSEFLQDFQLPLSKQQQGQRWGYAPVTISNLEPQVRLDL